MNNLRRDHVSLVAVTLKKKKGTGIFSVVCEKGDMCEKGDRKRGQKKGTGIFSVEKRGRWG
jgi:hypothetical protein